MQRRTPDDLTDGLDFLIRDSRLRLSKHIEGRIAGTGIPLRFWFPLRALYRNEGITQRELGQILGFGDARAGVVVGAMQRKRLVARRPDPTDRRKLALFLTPEGKRMAQATLRAMRATQATLLAGFSPAEATSVTALLGRVRENLREAT
jgi:MarR family transcriptional regulator, organic hydroperoxide resistance regulator